MQKLKKEIIDLSDSSEISSLFIVDISTGEVDTEMDEKNSYLIKSSIENQLQEIYKNETVLSKKSLLRHFDKKLVKITDDKDEIFWFYIYSIDSISGQSHIFLKVENISGFMEDYIDRIEILDEKTKLIEEYYEKSKDNLKRELHISSVKLQEKQQKFSEIYNFIKSKDSLPANTKKEILNFIKKSSMVQKYDYHFSTLGLYNNNYIKKISSLYPELSQKEAELCNLIKLGMNNQEISNFLNKSLRTVENHRFRIRKKLKLDRDISLGQFLSNI